VILGLVFLFEAGLPPVLWGYWIVFLLFFCWWQFAFSIFAVATRWRSADKKEGKRANRYILWLTVTGLALAVVTMRAAHTKARLLNR
jgi:hypothetical protein